MTAAPNPDPWATALAEARAHFNLAATDTEPPTEPTALDRWEDQGWTGPDDEDEVRAVYGGGAA